VAGVFSIYQLFIYALVRVPTLALSGVLTIGCTSFFWDGYFVFSLIIGFFMTSCLMMKTPREES